MKIWLFCQLHVFETKRSQFCLILLNLKKIRNGQFKIWPIVSPWLRCIFKLISPRSRPRGYQAVSWKNHVENIHKQFFDKSELFQPQNLTRLEEKWQELKLALEGQKSEKLNRRERAPSSDGLFYGHDLGITQWHEFEISEIVRHWTADLENQRIAAEIALNAPKVTWDDLQSILEGSFHTTVEEFESMISQSQVLKLLTEALVWLANVLSFWKPL